MSITLQVLKYEIVHSHFEYIFVVTDNNSNQSWTFKRRYSALRALYESLRRVCPSLIPFPPKKIFGNKNPRFLEQRKKQIESFFLTVLEMPAVRGSSQFQKFLTPKDRVPVGAEEWEGPALDSARPIERALNIKTDSVLVGRLKNIHEEISGQFINLTTSFSPPDPEETRNKTNYYNNSASGVLLQAKQGLPLALEDSAGDLREPLQNFNRFEENFNAIELLFSMNNEQTRSLLNNIMR